MKTDKALLYEVAVALIPEYEAAKGRIAGLDAVTAIAELRKRNMQHGICKKIAETEQLGLMHLNAALARTIKITGSPYLTCYPERCNSSLNIIESINIRVMYMKFWKAEYENEQNLKI